MTQPSISVIVPAYNAAATLEKCVQSVFGCATQGPVEVLVVDDGSTDDTSAVAHGLAANNRDRVRVLEHPARANRGTSASRNLALREARGELIAFLDADDWYLPGRFVKCVAALAAHRDIDGTIESAAVQLDSLRERDWWQAGDVVALAPQSQTELIDSLCFGHSFPVSGITLRRAVFSRSGLFNERLALTEDIELWIRVACVARLQVVEGEPVAVYRRHAGNRSRAARRDEMLPLIREARAWARAAGLPAPIQHQLEQAAFRYGIGLVDEDRRQGQRSDAAATLFKLARLHPGALARRAFWANCVGLLRSAP